METASRKVWMSLATLLTAIGASLCCILPVALAILGFGSAALGAQLEPLRPTFMTFTLLLLGFAFYREYRPAAKECGPDQECPVPISRQRQRIFLWVVAVLAVALLAFPHYMAAFM